MSQAIAYKSLFAIVWFVEIDLDGASGAARESPSREMQVLKKQDDFILKIEGVGMIIAFIELMVEVVSN